MNREDDEALERGRRMYPGRPFPPRIYGYQWSQHVPDWAYRSALESREVMVTKRDRMGQETATKVVQYKVPLNPPKAVLDRHAAMSREVADALRPRKESA